MDHGRGLGTWQPPEQPFAEALHLGQIFRFGPLPTAGPAANLAFEETLRATESVEPVAKDVDRMKLGQAVGEALAGPPRQVRHAAVDGGHFTAHDNAAAALHDKERRADDVRVLAHEIYPRRGREMGTEGVENAVFPGHVVGPGRDRPQWRPPQNVFRASRLQKIGEIRVASGKLLEGDPFLGPG